MIRKVTFYWIVLTLMLIDAWLLSKPNLLGKIGLIIYKYHYLRSFPRTLLTVWIVVSVAILIVLLVQYLRKQEKLSKILATVILAVFFVGSSLMMTKVYVDFTTWSYSHTGLKFRMGAYLLPAILMIIFVNGLIQIRSSKQIPATPEIEDDNVLAVDEIPSAINHDTSQP
jgi:hypothetical protein